MERIAGNTFEQNPGSARRSPNSAGCMLLTSPWALMRSRRSPVLLPGRHRPANTVAEAGTNLVGPCWHELSPLQHEVVPSIHQIDGQHAAEVAVSLCSQLARVVPVRTEGSMERSTTVCSHAEIPHLLRGTFRLCWRFCTSAARCAVIASRHFQDRAARIAGRSTSERSPFCSSRSGKPKVNHLRAKRALPSPDGPRRPWITKIRLV
jgi:hypothetical protein